MTHKNLTQKVLIGLALGMATGLLLNITGLVHSSSFVSDYLVSGLFHTIGTMFVNALKMLVVPLVLFSIIPGILGIGDIHLLGRVGIKALALYLSTTAIAIATALLAASVFSIGSGMSLSTNSDFEGNSAPPVTEVLINIIPSNPIAAMANGDMLAIIFFAIIFGVSLLAVAKEAPETVNLIEQLNKVMMKMVNLVMHFAPYAVFCLIAKAISELGLDLLKELLGYALVLIGVLLFHGFVSYSLILKILTGLNPGIFLKKLRATQTFAFSTASSAATIPVTLRTVEERLGVNNSIASFTVPLGATINMDGTAMMQGVATVFIANVYGIDLSALDYLMVIMMAVLASIGTAAVPSVGLVMLTMVFNEVNLPVEGIGLILGIDRILDMLRTAVNVTGDAAISTIVAKSEKRFDNEIYDNPEAGVITD